MKLLMDSDCLIKLTKSGLKPVVVEGFKVVVTETVVQEVVRAGMAKGLPDAQVVDRNISEGNIDVIGNPAGFEKGDDSLIGLFDLSRCNAVATDDARLAKRLKTHGIPFILPGLVVLRLFSSNRIDREYAIRFLDRLAEFISEDEYAAVKLLLEKGV